MFKKIASYFLFSLFIFGHAFAENKNQVENTASIQISRTSSSLTISLLQGNIKRVISVNYRNEEFSKKYFLGSVKEYVGDLLTNHVYFKYKDGTISELAFGEETNDGQNATYMVVSDDNICLLLDIDNNSLITEWANPMNPGRKDIEKNIHLELAHSYLEKIRNAVNGILNQDTPEYTGLSVVHMPLLKLKKNTQNGVGILVRFHGAPTHEQINEVENIYKLKKIKKILGGDTYLFSYYGEGSAENLIEELTKHKYIHLASANNGATIDGKK